MVQVPGQVDQAVLETPEVQAALAMVDTVDRAAPAAVDSQEAPEVPLPQAAPAAAAEAVVVVMAAVVVVEAVVAVVAAEVTLEVSLKVMNKVKTAQNQNTKRPKRSN